MAAAIFFRSEVYMPSQSRRQHAVRVRIDNVTTVVWINLTSEEYIEFLLGEFTATCEVMGQLRENSLLQKREFTEKNVTVLPYSEASIEKLPK